MKKPPLGQHFLTRSEIARWVAHAGGVQGDKTVLEIGPGHGILTRELLQCAKKVIAIEKDPTLYKELCITFSEEIASEKLILLETDVRDFSVDTCEHLQEKYSLVANIPYYITGMIIRTFLTTKNQPETISVLIQKEVAQRIVAKDMKHSLLSLSVHAYGTPTLEKVVKAGAFSPPPKVDSAILSIKNISRDNFQSIEQENRFFSLIHAGFASKRKMLRKQIANLITRDTYILCTVHEQDRAEDLTFSQWLCLASTGMN
jgi:16S rRNA (adenine1518-N6/adenine1519-N6)-dimethyltransferase